MNSFPPSELRSGLESIASQLTGGVEAPIPETILVTAPRRGEGKSTVAAGVAAVLAAWGRETLLASCDLRHPGVHGILRIPDRPGFEEALESPAEIADIAHATGIEGLEAIPSVPAPDPERVLGSDAMLRLLKVLRREADMVVIDAPGVLEAADASLLAAKVDAVLLVLRSGRTRTQEAIQSQDALDAFGASVRGVVLNSPGRKS